MKVCFKGLKQNFDPKEIEVIKKFILFLQQETPLKKDVHIFFLEEQLGKMTTGVSHKKNIIMVLAKGRMLIDILRTLSHEWVHEFQRSFKNFKEGPQIGGKNENMANILSGIFIKKFEKNNQKTKKTLYKQKR